MLKAESLKLLGTGYKKAASSIQLRRLFLFRYYLAAYLSFKNLPRALPAVAYDSANLVPVS